MTINELYIYASKQNLLNKEVNEVIELFKKDITILNQTLVRTKEDNTQISKANRPVIMGQDYWFNKVEFSIEDVLNLFST